MNTELMQILIQAGIFNGSAITDASNYNGGSSYVERMLALGHGSETDVIKVISNKLELAVVDASVFNFISQDVIAQIPKDLVMKHHILPFMSDQGTLHIAMVDPTQDNCLNELAFFTDKRLLPYGAKASDLAKALNKYFNIGIPENYIHKRDKEPAVDLRNEQTVVKEIPKPSILPQNKKTEVVKPVLPEIKKVVPKPALPIKEKPRKPSIIAKEKEQTEIGEMKEYTSIVEATLPSKSEKIAEDEIINKWAGGKEKNIGVASTEDIKGLLEKQKEIMEFEFNKRLEDIKSKFKEYEEDIKISKLKDELEEKMELKRTMDKISELEKMKYYQQSGYIPPYSAKGQIYVENTPEKESIKEKQSEMQPLFDKIKELQDQMSNLSQNVNSIHSEKKEEIIKEPINEPVKVVLPVDIKLPKDETSDLNIKYIEDEKENNELMDIDRIMASMNSSVVTASDEQLIVNSDQKEYKEVYDDIISNEPPKTHQDIDVNFFEEVFVNGMGVQVSNILKAKDVESALDAIVMEMSKLSTRTIILFVKFENLVGVSGFGPKIEGKVEDFKMPIILPSMFKKVYDSKKTYHGKPIINEITKKFYTYFGNLIPEYVAVVPAMIGKKVFAMVYSEEGKNIGEMEKIAQAMSTIFVKFLSEKDV